MQFTEICIELNVYRQTSLTLYFAMSLNGQTHFKNLAADARPFYVIAK